MAEMEQMSARLDGAGGMVDPTAAEFEFWAATCELELETSKAPTTMKVTNNDRSTKCQMHFFEKQ
jgi:hypothetical protein